jgi:hypothetical protein
LKLSEAYGNSEKKQGEKFWKNPENDKLFFRSLLLKPWPEMPKRAWKAQFCVSSIAPL